MDLNNFQITASTTADAEEIKLAFSDDDEKVTDNIEVFEPIDGYDEYPDQVLDSIQVEQSEEKARVFLKPRKNPKSIETLLPDLSGIASLRSGEFYEVDGQRMTLDEYIAAKKEILKKKLEVKRIGLGALIHTQLAVPVQKFLSGRMVTSSKIVRENFTRFRPPQDKVLKGFVDFVPLLAVPLSGSSIILGTSSTETPDTYRFGTVRCYSNSLNHNLSNVAAYGITRFAKRTIGTMTTQAGETKNMYGWDDASDQAIEINVKPLLNYNYRLQPPSGDFLGAVKVLLARAVVASGGTDTLTWYAAKIRHAMDTHKSGFGPKGLEMVLQRLAIGQHGKNFMQNTSEPMPNRIVNQGGFMAAYMFGSTPGSFDRYVADKILVGDSALPILKNDMIHIQSGINGITKLSNIAILDTKPLLSEEKIIGGVDDSSVYNKQTTFVRDWKVGGQKKGTPVLVSYQETDLDLADLSVQWNAWYTHVLNSKGATRNQAWESVDKDKRDLAFLVRCFYVSFVENSRINGLIGRRPVHILSVYNRKTKSYDRTENKLFHPSTGVPYENNLTHYRVPKYSSHPYYGFVFTKMMTIKAQDREYKICDSFVEHFAMFDSGELGKRCLLEHAKNTVYPIEPAAKQYDFNYVTVGSENSILDTKDDGKQEQYAAFNLQVAGDFINDLKEVCTEVKTEVKGAKGVTFDHVVYYNPTEEFKEKWQYHLFGAHVKAKGDEITEKDKLTRGYFSLEGPIQVVIKLLLQPILENMVGLNQLDPDDIKEPGKDIPSYILWKFNPLGGDMTRLLKWYRLMSKVNYPANKDGENGCALVTYDIGLDSYVGRVVPLVYSDNVYIIAPMVAADERGFKKFVFTDSDRTHVKFHVISADGPKFEFFTNRETIAKAVATMFQLTYGFNLESLQTNEEVKGSKLGKSHKLSSEKDPTYRFPTWILIFFLEIFPQMASYRRGAVTKDIQLELGMNPSGLQGTAFINFCTSVHFVLPLYGLHFGPGEVPDFTQEVLDSGELPLLLRQIIGGQGGRYVIETGILDFSSNVIKPKEHSHDLLGYDVRPYHISLPQTEYEQEEGLFYDPDFYLLPVLRADRFFPAIAYRKRDFGKDVNPYAARIAKAISMYWTRCYANPVEVEIVETVLSDVIQEFKAQNGIQAMESAYMMDQIAAVLASLDLNLKVSVERGATSFLVPVEVVFSRVTGVESSVKSYLMHAPTYQFTPEVYQAIAAADKDVLMDITQGAIPGLSILGEIFVSTSQLPNYMVNKSRKVPVSGYKTAISTEKGKEEAITAVITFLFPRIQKQLRAIPTFNGDPNWRPQWRDGTGKVQTGCKFVLPDGKLWENFIIPSTEAGGKIFRDYDEILDEVGYKRMRQIQETMATAVKLYVGYNGGTENMRRILYDNRDGDGVKITDYIIAPPKRIMEGTNFFIIMVAGR